MKRKVFSLALALTMGLGLLSVPASAAAKVTVVKPVEGYESSAAYEFQGFSEGILSMYLDVYLDADSVFLDSSGNPITDEYYERYSGDVIPTFSEGLMRVKPKQTNHDTQPDPGWGYIDKTGKMVIAPMPQYSAVGNFCDGVALVRDGESKKLGAIDTTGKLVIPCEYSNSDLRTASEGLLRAYDAPNGYWGYFDTKGNLAIPFQYASAGDFKGGFAEVQLGQKETFIDKTGRDIIPDQYKDIEQLKIDGEPAALFWAWDATKLEDNNHYLLNGSGQVIAGPYYDIENSAYSGLLKVRKFNRSSILTVGYINIAGQEVIPCGQFKSGENFVDGYAMVITADGNRAIVNTAGQITATLSNNGYTGVDSSKFSEGMLAVSSAESGKTRYGFLNASGQLVVECKYRDVEAFSCGLAVVTDFAGKKGLVNTAGQEVVPCEYNKISKFSNGVAIVSKDNGSGLMNTAGQEILPCKYNIERDYKVLSLLEDNNEVSWIIHNKETGDYEFVHISSDYSAPAQPAVPVQSVVPATNTAYASTQTVLVDGKAVEFQCYALKDAGGNDTNYIKLRDIASVLNGTAVQFQVGWNGAVNIETGKAYTANGSEMSTPFSGNREYGAATAATNVNGAAAALEAIVLTDDAGGAYSYYKLRDLGTALGFQVDWSAEKGIFIETK